MTEPKLSKANQYVSKSVYDGIRKTDPEVAMKRVEAFKEKTKKLEDKRASVVPAEG